MKRTFFLLISITLVLNVLAQNEVHSIQNDTASPVLHYQDKVYVGSRSTLLEMKNLDSILQPSDTRIIILPLVTAASTEHIAIFVQEINGTWLEAWRAPFFKDVLYDSLTLNPSTDRLVIRLVSTPRSSAKRIYFPITLYKVQHNWL